MDLLLNDSHDLALVGYDLVMATGIDLMRQRLKQSLLFFQGEWYLDIEDGVPYYQDILKKSPDQIAVEAAFKTAIIETPGVTEITAFALKYDAPLRSLSLSFGVKTIYGNLQLSETF